MTIDSNFTFTYTDDYTQLLTDLHNDYCRDEPTDVVQYCADFFNRKLAEQRSFYRNSLFNGKFGTDEKCTSEGWFTLCFLFQVETNIIL